MKRLNSETYSTRESSITNDQILALLRPKKEFVHAQSMVERRSKRRACISSLDSEQMTRLSLVMCILSGVKILYWVSRTNGKSRFSLLFMGSTVSRRVPWLIPSSCICSISAYSCFTNKDLLVSKTTTRSWNCSQPVITKIKRYDFLA